MQQSVNNDIPEEPERLNFVPNIIYASETCHQNSNQLLVQYYCYVSPSVSRDQFTALPLEGVLVIRTYILYI